MRKKCNIRLRRLTLWMLACLTAACLLPGRAEAGGSQSDGQTGPQGGTTISDGNRRVLEGWAAQTGRITGEPGAGVLYFKKERDE